MVTQGVKGLSIKEWVSFFRGSWEMNRSAEQTNRMNREAVLVRFVCSALRFISHEPRKKAVHAICLFRTAIHFPWTEKKKDIHSLFLQCFQQWLFLKFAKKS